jgi:hypothetical protein
VGGERLADVQLMKAVAWRRMVVVAAAAPGLVEKAHLVVVQAALVAAAGVAVPQTRLP